MAISNRCREISDKAVFEPANSSELTYYGVLSHSHGMKAELVTREKIIFSDGAIIEIKVWRVPNSVPASKPFLKYSLFYGRPGQRLVGYDNERGKGDHRHYGTREENYIFTSIN